MDAEEKVTCPQCGSLMSTDEYAYDHRDACRELRGLVPCDDARCTAKDEPTTLEEFKVALEHWRTHSCLHGCSHGN